MRAWVCDGEHAGAALAAHLAALARPAAWRIAAGALCVMAGAAAQAQVRAGVDAVEALIPPKEAVAPGAGAGLPDSAALIEARKSYVIPALEIVGFDFLLNRFNRRYSQDYDSSLSSIRRNLRGPWVVDDDPYQTNQLGHPYQGSMYHGFARSAGLYLRGQRGLGDRRRENAAVEERPDHHRHRRQLSGRGAVPHVQPGAGARQPAAPLA
jgi:hypothetical protein